MNASMRFFLPDSAAFTFLENTGKRTYKVGFHALTAVNVFLVSKLQLNAEILWQ